MSLVSEIDYGTPASQAEKTVSLTIDGVEVTVPEGTSIMRAAMEAGIKVPKLCAYDMVESFGSCRAVPRRDRGPRRPARLLHDAGRRRHDGHDADERLAKHPPQRDGALRLRFSARCRPAPADGNCEMQDMAGARRPARGALRPRRRQSSRRPKRTSPIPISPSIRRNASSARAACAPARKCRAPSR